MASKDDRDEPVSLHPVDPREALRALLNTKLDPARKNGQESSPAKKKPAPSGKQK